MHFWLNCEIGNSDDFGYYYKVENSEKPDVVGDFFDTDQRYHLRKTKLRIWTSSALEMLVWQELENVMT